MCIELKNKILKKIFFFFFFGVVGLFLGSKMLFSHVNCPRESHIFHPREGSDSRNHSCWESVPSPDKREGRSVLENNNKGVGNTFTTFW
jgi:hypothetical protein